MTTSNWKSIVDTLFKVIDCVSNVLLIILTFLVALEVMGRSFFNNSFIYVTPLTSVVFPWMVFLAIIGATKNNEHISVNFVLNKLPFKAKKTVLLFNKLVMLFFSIFMLFSSYNLSMSVAEIMEPIINISKFWLYSSMIVAFAGTAIVIFVQIISIIKNNEIEEEKNDLDYDY